jgi:hypothetical protein
MGQRLVASDDGFCRSRSHPNTERPSNARDAVLGDQEGFQP